MGGAVRVCRPEGPARAGQKVGISRWSLPSSALQRVPYGEISKCAETTVASYRRLVGASAWEQAEPFANWGFLPDL